MLAAFSAATFLWLLWVLPRLRVRNTAVAGSLLLSVGGIEVRSLHSSRHLGFT
jgi:hypothetical protein